LPLWQACFAQAKSNDKNPIFSGFHYACPKSNGKQILHQNKQQNETFYTVFLYYFDFLAAHSLELGEAAKATQMVLGESCHVAHYMNYQHRQICLCFQPTTYAARLRHP
jgi:hypothetical protein